jgi:hypothetical protein
MASLPGRSDRRRRVLNEDVLSASSSHAVLRAAQADRTGGDEAPRYSDAAGVENHPQITDFVPRRHRTFALLIAGGTAAVAGLAALNYFAYAVANTFSMPNTAPVELAAAGSLGTWFAAVTLFVASAACMLVYSIRRHRIDDYRGRYRAWFAASLACLLASANSVVAAHHVLASLLSHHTGWFALRGGAAWWLAIAGLPLMWITVRTLLDALECRLAAALLSGAVVSYTAALASYLGWLPIADSQVEPIATGTLALLGNWLLLVGVVAYARFVILDAQGLIPARQRPAKQRPAGQVALATGTTPARKTEPASITPPATKATMAASASKPSSAPLSQWVDGSRRVRESYGDDDEDEDEDDETSDGGRKLSKADRKRLRKLKSQERAA